MYNKSTILTEPSDAATTTSDCTSALTEVPDINDLLAVAHRKLGDSYIAQELISNYLNMINEWLKFHGLFVILAIHG